MEALVTLFAIALLAMPLTIALVFVQLAGLRRRLDQLEQRLQRQRQQAATLPTEPPPLPAAAAAAAPPPAATARSAADDMPAAAKPPAPAAAALDRPEPATPVPAPTPSPARDLEAEIGSRWLVLAGAGALFLGVAFLLKWSFDRGLFGPTARVVGGAGLGLSLWLAGFFWRQRYRLLAHGFFAAGSCVLYASAWAAHMLYQLAPHALAFAAMLLITATTLLLAARLQALPLAVLALVGGFATPALLPAPSQAPHALLGYAAMLTLAAMLLRRLRDWRLLNGLALAGTALLLAGWALQQPAPQAHATALLLWGAGFALLFLAGGPGPDLLRARPLAPADLQTALVAAGLWLLLVIALQAWHDSRLAAALAALLAIAFAAAALVHGRRSAADRRGREALWLGAAVLIAATAPLALREHALTVALAAVGLVLVRAGDRLPAKPMLVVGVLALGWAVLRALELRWQVALPQQWHGDGGPLWRLPLLVELLVAGAVLALAFLQPRWRPAVAALALLLLVPIAAGELMQQLVARRWPHADASFDALLAWALSLAAAAAVLLRSPRPAMYWLRVACGGAAALVTLVAGGIGCAAATAPWLLQYALLLAPLVALALLPGAPPRGSGLHGTMLAAVLVQTVLAWARLWQAWLQPSADAVALVLLLVVALLLLLAQRLAAAPERLRVGAATAAAALLPMATVLLWSLLVPSPLRPALVPQPAPVPLALAMALPPAAVALAGRRLRWLGTLAPELGSAVALALALLAWQELVLGATDVQPQALVLLLPAALLLLLAWLGPGDLRGKAGERLLRCAQLLAVVALASREAWRLGARLGDDPLQGAQTGLSICWAAAATAALLGGIAARIPVLRHGALLLFGLTLAKLVLVDLAQLPLPYRVLSFLALGASLMGGGWLYHRFAARIRPAAGS